MNYQKNQPPTKSDWQKLPLLIQLYVVIRVFFDVDIPSLRPIQLVIPATVAQIVAFILAALLPGKFFIIFLTGLFIVIGVFMFPMLRQPQKQTAHWVKGDADQT